MINELILQYIELATEIRHDVTLGPPVKGTVLLQLAQALSSLVPLATQGEEQALQQQQQMDQAQKQHAQQMQMAQQKHDQQLQITAQKHALDMQKVQESHQMQMKQANTNEQQTK